MASPRRRPLAELQAAADTRKALEFAVREHERQLRLQEEADIQRRLGPSAPKYRPPMRESQMGAPRAQVGGLAQTVPLHQQDMQRYRSTPQAPPLTPAQQEALDAQNDYLADWTAVDEAGRRHLLPRPMSEQLNISPPSAEGRRLEEQARAMDLVEKPVKRQRPQRRMI